MDSGKGFEIFLSMVIGFLLRHLSTVPASSLTFKRTIDTPPPAVVTVIRYMAEEVEGQQAGPADLPLSTAIACLMSFIAFLLFVGLWASQAGTCNRLVDFFTDGLFPMFDDASFNGNYTTSPDRFYISTSTSTADLPRDVSNVREVGTQTDHPVSSPPAPARNIDADYFSMSPPSPPAPKAATIPPAPVVKTSQNAGTAQDLPALPPPPPPPPANTPPAPNAFSFQPSRPSSLPLRRLNPQAHIFSAGTSIPGFTFEMQRGTMQKETRDMSGSFFKSFQRLKEPATPTQDSNTASPTSGYQFGKDDLINSTESPYGDFNFTPPPPKRPETSEADREGSEDGESSADDDECQVTGADTSEQAKKKKTKRSKNKLTKAQRKTKAAQKELDRANGIEEPEQEVDLTIGKMERTANMNSRQRRAMKNRQEALVKKQAAEEAQKRVAEEEERLVREQREEDEDAQWRDDNL